MKDLEKFLTGDHVFEGIRTGFETIDEKTGGLADGNLILLGGRPDMGMTSLQKILEQMIGKRLSADEPISEEDYEKNVEVSLEELKQSPLLIEHENKYVWKGRTCQ